MDANPALNASAPTRAETLSATPVDDPRPVGIKRFEFDYDYMNRRVEKREWTWNGTDWNLTTKRRFLYDGWNLLMELDGLDGNSVVRKFTWGLDLSGQSAPSTEGIHGAGGIGGLLACYYVAGSANYGYFYDANGNVGPIRNVSSGASAAEYEHDPYGNVLIANGTFAATNPFRFSTKYFDDEFGQCYYGHRFYDPRWGRWTSRDLVNESEYANLYEFSLNSLPNWIDPDGRAPVASQPVAAATTTAPAGDSCGIEIHQSPHCLFGDPGHTWLTWGSGELGETAECPADYINRPARKCEKDYTNNKWRVRKTNGGSVYGSAKTCSKATCADIKTCLRKFAQDKNDSFHLCDNAFCKNQYHCRIFSEDAMRHCCLERGDLFYVDALAPLRYCCSPCAKGQARPATRTTGATP